MNVNVNIYALKMNIYSLDGGVPQFDPRQEEGNRAAFNA